MKKWFGLLIATVCLVCFAVPSMAAENNNWTLSGQVGLFTSVTSFDNDAAVYNNVKDLNKTQTKFDSWDLLRLGAEYKTDKVSGEIVVMDDRGAVILDTAVVALDFGSWNLAFGRQDPLTANYFALPRGKYGTFAVGTDFGGTADDPKGMFAQNPTGGKLGLYATFPFSKAVELQLMLGSPNPAYVDYGTAADPTDPATGNHNFKLPLMEAKLNFNTGFPWSVYGGYQKVDGTYASGEKTVTSWTVGAAMMPRFGSFRLKATVNYDVNMYMGQGAAYQNRPTATYKPFYLWQYDPDVAKTTQIGAGIAAEYMFTKSFGVTTGYSRQQWKSGDNYKSDISTAWINTPIYLSLSPRIMIMPYIAWRMGGDSTLDFMNPGTGAITKNLTFKEGTTTEYGVWWNAWF